MNHCIFFLLQNRWKQMRNQHFCTLYYRFYNPNIFARSCWMFFAITYDDKCFELQKFSLRDVIVFTPYSACFFFCLTQITRHQWRIQIQQTNQNVWNTQAHVFQLKPDSPERIYRYPTHKGHFHLLKALSTAKNKLGTLKAQERAN